MATSYSILLYGAEIWADALDAKAYSKRLTDVQRQGALRIACAYRTVSLVAVQVVAGVIPIDLVAKERKTIHDNSKVTSRQEAADTARTKTMTKWTDRWTRDTTGSGTRRLIGELGP